jgi:hypothetical protein
MPTHKFNFTPAEAAEILCQQLAAEGFIDPAVKRHCVIRGSPDGIELEIFNERLSDDTPGSPEAGTQLEA